MSSLGLTVYGPEVAKSGLTAALDDFIRRKTGLEIAERFFAVHSRASIEAFYTLTGSTGGRHWPLVLDLFDMRPVFATLWTGPNALAVLQNVKGKTQPAQAANGSVRSCFYCDNPVTNLLHVSDSDSVMDAELQILRSQSTGTDGAGWHALDSGRVSHSSFRVLLSILDSSGACETGAREGNDNALKHARAAFEQAQVLASRKGVLPIVQGYLAGDPDSLGNLLKHAGRVSAWDRLILEAGLFAMPVWGPLIRPVPALRSGAGS
ncbi:MULTISPECIES: nucleoside-diphosphate kinase [unclassified Sinorhizobium]|uniref:nucleoside-diphosphate kinase n=1 Tax=unclassified Sinorhizobium TaxID=2613772 RepID=UPI0035244912